MEQPRIVRRQAMAVVGISTRTRNSGEADPTTAKIAGLWARFFAENIGAQVPGKVHPHVVAVYSDYESDETGEYALTVGHEVGGTEPIPDGLVVKTVPSGRYAVITTDRGALPDIVIDAWKRIWTMTPEDLGGRRAFAADFELYDERAREPQDAQVEIYIGIK